MIDISCTFRLPEYTHTYIVRAFDCGKKTILHLVKVLMLKLTN